MDIPEALQRALEGQVIMVRVENARAARDLVARLPIVRRAAVFGDRLHVTVESAERDGPVVEAALREAGFPVLERQVIVPSMEDVFIDHMAREGAA